MRALADDRVADDEIIEALTKYIEHLPGDARGTGVRGLLQMIAHRHAPGRG